MDQALEDDEDVVNDLQQPKAKRKKPSTQGYWVKLLKGNSKMKKHWL
jgi:hypothetical protein